MDRVVLRLSRDDIQKQFLKALPIEIVVVAVVAYFLELTMPLIAAVAGLILLAHSTNLWLTTRHTYMTIVPDGFLYKTLRGREIKHSWEDEIQVRNGSMAQFPAYVFVEEGALANVAVPKQLFAKKDVAAFIDRHAPGHHRFRELSANAS